MFSLRTQAREAVMTEYRGVTQPRIMWGKTVYRHSQGTNRNGGVPGTEQLGRQQEGNTAGRAQNTGTLEKAHHGRDPAYKHRARRYEWYSLVGVHAPSRGRYRGQYYILRAQVGLDVYDAISKHTCRGAVSMQMQGTQCTCLGMDSAHLALIRGRSQATSAAGQEEVLNT
jgi:hypothetical protein